MTKFQRTTRLATLLFAITTLTACAFGQKIAYNKATADISATGDKSVAVASHDQRPYILSGDKQPDFVGLSRGGFGNPFDIRTESGAPLADDFSAAITAALNAKGFQASTVIVAPTQSAADVLAALKATAAERQLLVTFKEWKSDTYASTKFLYDVTIQIHDADGTELTSVTFKDEERVDRKAVGDVFGQKIERWFSDARVVEALQ